jgi:putative chitinase
MTYFTINELITSNTAKVKGIDNSPTNAVRANLVALIETLLDPLREAWKSPIRVTSGYRCGVLNRVVGGSTTSAHLYGCAADIVPLNGKIAEFKAFCRDYFSARRHLYDQVILEDNGKSEWVHIGLKTKDGRKRGQLMEYKNNRYTYL